MGRREAVQSEMWVAAKDLPRSADHVFYTKLNRLLADADFDRRVEELCRPYYADDQGRPSIAPGVYFRMLFVGFFERLGSQRAIAWKCSDSLSVREFLGVPISADSPDHSSMTRIRQRLPLEVHVQGFLLVLEIAREKGILRGKTLAVDATMLEANAAMKSMVHRVSEKNWRNYLKQLAKEAGIENPSDEDLRRLDRKRKGKKVSNEEWKSPTDPDSRIARMKDGTKHFAYKAEHAVDVDSDLIVAAEVLHATDPIPTRSWSPQRLRKRTSKPSEVSAQAKRCSGTRGTTRRRRWSCSRRALECGRTFPSRRRATSECGPTSRRDGRQRCTATGDGPEGHADDGSGG